MKIGFTLDEVLRDFVGQLLYIYEKYNDEVDLDYEDIKTNNLFEYLPFKNIDEYNKFLYEDASLEIFGHAQQVGENTMYYFNNFLVDVYDEEEHYVEIVSKEHNFSIPSTLFFLSKLGCRIKNIRFVDKYEDVWDGLDVLVTATPQLIELKPKDKFLIKVNCPYNEGLDSDYNVDDVIDLINDYDKFNEIINNEIIKQ